MQTKCSNKLIECVMCTELKLLAICFRFTKCKNGHRTFRTDKAHFSWIFAQLNRFRCKKKNVGFIYVPVQLFHYSTQGANNENKYSANFPKFSQIFANIRKHSANFRKYIPQIFAIDSTCLCKRYTQFCENKLDIGLLNTCKTCYTNNIGPFENQ